MKRKLKTYFELTKPRLTSLVILTTWLGYAFAARPMHYNALFFHALMGSWLVASGAAALNEYMERDRDALMKRTQTRPLAAKAAHAGGAALWFGATISTLGVLELAFFVNPLTSLLSLISLRQLSVGLYAAQDADVLVYARGRDSRRHSSDDGMDGGPQ